MYSPNNFDESILRNRGLQHDQEEDLIKKFQTFKNMAGNDTLILQPFKTHFNNKIKEKEEQINANNRLLQYLDESLEEKRSETELNEIYNQQKRIGGLLNNIKSSLAKLTLVVEDK
tara:strand:+ start:188 stop:535 length:348 start_codon:yes stop_codon:yes gene_type:complete